MELDVRKEGAAGEKAHQQAMPSARLRQSQLNNRSNKHRVGSIVILLDKNL